MNVHFNSYKIKYVNLNSFFRPIKNSHSIKNINIFINLDDLFHNLHRPLINNEFQMCGINAGKQLISNIFNLIGHYRHWAIKEGMRVSIYAVYTSNLRPFKNSMYNKDYRKKFKDYHDPNSGQYYFINEAIKASHSLLQTISNYIPNVYIIDSKYIEPSVVPLYISKDINYADWNILISRDSYDLQYAYKDKWTYITPRGEKSSSITRQNMWEYINTSEKIFDECQIYQYDYNLYPLIQTVVGNVYRNIPRLKRIGWKTIFKYLEEIRKSSIDDMSCIVIQNRLVNLLHDKNVTIEEFNNNSYCVDVEKQYDTMMELDKSVILSQIKDIPDFENLKVMNTRHFIGMQINLDFLCQENISNKNPWKKY